MTDAESLIDRLAHLRQAIAPLRALHGPGGTWDHARKIMLSLIREEIRASAPAKATAADLDAQAHADVRYRDMMTESLSEKAELASLEGQAQVIEWRLQFAKTAAYSAARLGEYVP